jgi:hypothetical protein
MYEHVLRQMQRAVEAGRVRFTSHAFDEMDDEGLLAADAINCILTGEIVEDQYDARYQQTKYLIYGDTMAGDELGLVARFEITTRVLIITVYRLTIKDYD